MSISVKEYRATLPHVVEIPANTHNRLIFDHRIPEMQRELGLRPPLFMSNNLAASFKFRWDFVIMSKKIRLWFLDKKTMKAFMKIKERGATLEEFYPHEVRFDGENACRAWEMIAEEICGSPWNAADTKRGRTKARWAVCSGPDGNATFRFLQWSERNEVEKRIQLHLMRETVEGKFPFEVQIDKPDDEINRAEIVKEFGPEGTHNSRKRKWFSYLGQYFFRDAEEATMFKLKFA
jgi:hypothetical protein